MSDIPATGEPAALAGLIVGDDGPVDFSNDAIMAQLGAIRDAVVLPALERTRSRLVEADDVDLLVECPSAADAVSCALAIQSGMAARNGATGQAERFHFRFGIDLHAGRAADQTGAGAIATCGDPGDIWMTAPVAAQAREPIGIRPLDCGVRPIGASGEPLLLCRLAPEQPAGALPRPPIPSVPPQTDVREGAVLNGTYRIDSLIAQGGMGEVFKGHEIHSGGVVAVKLLRSDMSSNRVALGLFQKEAQILKEIYHDAIVRYFLFSFEQSLQRHYLAMEFVDGVALVDLIKEGPLSFEQVSTLRQRLASALFVAHERGIIHRDISPDNIIIPGGNVARAKVIDFGIARAAEIGGGTLIGGGFAGKYNYVSPEQLGLAGGEITPKSDIYSLGLVLAECSLGKALEMDGSQAEVIEKRRRVPDLLRLDPRLRPLIAQMLQPEPADRPNSMAAIANWAAAVPEQAPPPAKDRDGNGKTGTGTATPSDQRGGTSRRRWLIGVAAAALVLAAGSVGLYEGWYARTPRPVPNTPHDASESPPTLAPPSTDTPPKTDAGSPASEDGQHQAGTSDTASAEQPTPPASTPPASAVQAEGAAQPEAMAAFTRSFAPTACFMAKAVQFTPTSALVEAFGLSREDFATFDRDFSAKFGIAPDVAGYRVWSKQCPAVAFARQISGNAEKNPFLLLKSMRVGSGQPISGEVRNAGDTPLTLLMVREDGTVRNLSDALKAHGDAWTFDLPNDARPSAVPQLLIVLANNRPLKTVQNGPLTADALFPALQSEITAGAKPIGIDTKLFLLGG